MMSATEKCYQGLNRHDNWFLNVVYCQNPVEETNSDLAFERKNALDSRENSVEQQEEGGGEGNAWCKLTVWWKVRNSCCTS